MSAFDTILSVAAVMKMSAQEPFPPRLSMDSYVTFVEESFRAQAPPMILRQKKIEERIEKAFDMGERFEDSALRRRSGADR